MCCLCVTMAAVCVAILVGSLNMSLALCVIMAAVCAAVLVGTLDFFLALRVALAALAGLLAQDFGSFLALCVVLAVLLLCAFAVLLALVAVTCESILALCVSIPVPHVDECLGEPPCPRCPRRTLLERLLCSEACALSRFLG